MSDNNQQWLASIKQELESNILSFWMEHTLDEKNGGFHGFISRDLTVNHECRQKLSA